MRVISLANQKGGVGKTSTTYHLSRALVKKGYSVLVIDTDPQGNATQLLSREKVEHTDLGLADALYSTISQDIRNKVISLDSVAIQGIWDGLKLIPTSGDQLGFVRDHITVSGTGRESRLKELISSVNCDVVLIDCPPSLDQLTINALTASDEVLVIAHPDLLSLNGMAQLFKTIDNVRLYYNSGLKILGVLVNEAEENQLSSRYWRLQLQSISKNQEWDVLDPVIPRRVAIKRAIEQEKGLDELKESQSLNLAEIYAIHAAKIMEERS